MESPLSFKEYYRREINAICFTYGERESEAKRNFPSSKGKQQYREYLNLYFKKG